MKNQH